VESSRSPIALALEAAARRLKRQKLLKQFQGGQPTRSLAALTVACALWGCTGNVSSQRQEDNAHAGGGGRDRGGAAREIAGGQGGQGGDQPKA